MTNEIFSEEYAKYLETRTDVFNADPSEVLCTKHKNPGLEKIKKHCQPRRCKRLASIAELQEKGL